MDISREFIANEKSLVFYTGKPIINRQHVFTDSCGAPYYFSEAIAFTFNVWQEREGGLLMIPWTSPENLSANGDTIFLNAPASDTEIDRGKYYYELAYIVSGGYEILLAYGDANFI